MAPGLLEDGITQKKETPYKSVRTSTVNFLDEYELLKILGTGSYSVCRLARHRSTGQLYAVKV